MLHKLVNDLPIVRIHLGQEVKDEKSKEITFKPLCEINAQLSDHDILVGSNEHGTIATWNMWNQDSPVSPGFVPATVKDAARLYIKEEKNQHIELVAKRIIDLLANGVDAVALQEAPMDSVYKAMFIAVLKKLAKEAALELDFDAFEKSYTQTKKPLKGGKDNGYHEFATALLFKSNAFTLEKIASFAEGRGSEYALTSAKSKKNLTLINFHGDYGQALVSAQQLFTACSKPDVMVVGDTNIPLTNEKAIEQLKSVPGVVVEPATNRNDIANAARTLDCFVTAIPQTTYIYKIAMKNYAKNETNENMHRLFVSATSAGAAPAASQALEKGVQLNAASKK